MLFAHCVFIQVVLYLIKKVGGDFAESLIAPTRTPLEKAQIAWGEKLKTESAAQRYKQQAYYLFNVCFLIIMCFLLCVHTHIYIYIL